MLQHKGTCHGDRGHGTRQREGGDDIDLPMRGHGDQPFGHGDIKLQGRIGVDDAQKNRAVMQPIGRGAQHEGGHFDPVHGAGMAQRLGLPAFVQMADLGVVDIEMPGVGGQVERFEGAAAFLMDHVQGLDQLEEIAQFGKCAVAAATVIVHDIGRATDRGVDAEAAADHQVTGRVAGLQSEACGHGGKAGGQHVGIKADGITVDARARLCEQGAGLGRQDAHALFGQHAQGGMVDGGDLIIRDHLDRGQQPFGLAKGALRQPACGARGDGSSAPLGPGHSAASGSWKSRGAKGASRRTMICDAARPSSRAVLCP